MMITIPTYLSVSLHHSLSGHSASSYHRAEAAAAAATTSKKKKKKNSFTATSIRRSQRTSTGTTSAPTVATSIRKRAVCSVDWRTCQKICYTDGKKAQVMSSREEYALDIRH